MTASYDNIVGIRFIEGLDPELNRYVIDGLLEVNPSAAYIDGSGDVIDILAQIKASNFNCYIDGLTITRLLKDDTYTPLQMNCVLEVVRAYGPSCLLLAIIEDEYPNLSPTSDEAAYLGWLTSEELNPLLTVSSSWTRSKLGTIIGFKSAQP